MEINILCIDDDPIVLGTRKLLLQHAGFSVLTAQSGSEGLDLFVSHPVSAVVLDYAMPEMAGPQVAAEMKRLNPAIPILMLSAYMFLPDGSLNNVDAFLTKGENPKIFLDRISELISVQATNGKPQDKKEGIRLVDGASPTKGSVPRARSSRHGVRERRY